MPTLLALLPPLVAQYNYAYPAPANSGTDWTAFGLLVLILCGLLSTVVHQKMQRAFTTYSHSPAPLTGAQTAQRMLAAYVLPDIRITCVRGRLTDHYNPLDRTVNLSETVYNQATVAAMAVAAHECGHAVQHAEAYPWLSLRSSLVPMVQVGARAGQWMLLAGLFMLAAGGDSTVAWLGLGLFGTSTLFAFVTLPVEFDASRRALAWLRRSELAQEREQSQAGEALRWAAMTYVAAALSSLAMMVYYALYILSRSDNKRR